MKCVFWCLILYASLVNSEYAPRGCQWLLTDLDDRVEIKSDVKGEFLSCRLRTLSSANELLGNLSAVQSEKMTSLRLECNDMLLLESSLGPFFLSGVRNLRQLYLERCKFRHVLPGAFSKTRDLRRLVLRSHNREWRWGAMLELQTDSFRGLPLLNHLDLSGNNIRNVPEDLLCPVPDLRYLNLTGNRLHDLLTLGRSPCAAALDTLDLSDNELLDLPDDSLTQLGSLISLHLQKNAISTMGERALAGLSELQHLDLSYNHLASLPPELFTHTRQLRRLLLRNNSLNVLAPGLLEDLEELHTLDLASNELTSRWINRETFRGLSRLALLDLSNNKLTRVDVRLFEDAKNLQLLDLSDNAIEIIAERAFFDLPDLQVLRLSRNKLSSIDINHFSGNLNGLRRLLLDANRLVHIHDKAFANITALHDLSLAGNVLERVPSVLKSLHLLRTLDLGDNQISTIDKTSFEGLDSLYGLRLVDNHIENVSRDALSTLPSLQVLNLASNRISHVEQSAFARNPSLRAIRLDSNLLSDVSGVFTNLNSLVWLNVSSNRLINFDYGHMPPSLQWLDIHENLLTELANFYDVRGDALKIEMLDASFNRIEQISSISVPDGVKTLLLNNNLIRYIQPGTFLAKHRLEKVALNNNNLEHLDLAAMALNTQLFSHVDEQFSPVFYISENPFSCDCTMEWLTRAKELSTKSNYPQFQDLDSIKCSTARSPEIFRPLTELKPGDFLCSYESHCFSLCHCCDFIACDCEMACPKNCTCYHDHTWTNNVVDCSNAGYKSVPERIPMDATEIRLDGNDLGELSAHVFIGKKKLRALYLNGSNVAGVHDRTFKGTDSLKVLHLEHNQIPELRGGEFEDLKRLEELYLDHNKIAKVHNETFTHMRELHVLKLDGNDVAPGETPWKKSLQRAVNPILSGTVTVDGNRWPCDCASLTRLTERLNAECVDGGGAVIGTVGYLLEQCGVGTQKTIATSVIHRDVLFLSDGYIPLLAGALVTVIVVCLFAAIVFVFRQEVRLWIHSKYGVRLFADCEGAGGNNSEEIAERLYDCYVLVGGREAEVVGGWICSQLEQAGYTVCLHHRDVQVTTSSDSPSPYLAEAMASAAEASRRLLLVTSSGLANDEWRRPEFRAGVAAAVRTSARRKPLCVLVGGPQPSPSDPELRAVMRVCTLLRWEDSRFWEKLRYSMPDPSPREPVSRKSPVKNTNHKKPTPYNVGQIGGDGWYTGAALTPTPTQSTYVSDELNSSSSGSHRCDSERASHGYMSIEECQASRCPSYAETAHVYSTIPEHENLPAALSATRTYFV